MHNCLEDKASIFLGKFSEKYSPYPLGSHASARRPYGADTAHHLFLTPGSGFTPLLAPLLLHLCPITQTTT